MPCYSFVLPYPPSVNGYWRSFRNRQIISKRGREYVKLVDTKMKELNLHREGLDCALKFKMVINPPTLRSYDVDNFTKGVFDALSKCGFWVDDSQVQILTIIKGEKVKGGIVKVDVWKLD